MRRIEIQVHGEVRFFSYNISFVKSKFIPKLETNTILSNADAFYITSFFHLKYFH